MTRMRLFFAGLASAWRRRKCCAKGVHRFVGCALPHRSLLSPPGVPWDAGFVRGFEAERCTDCRWLCVWRAVSKKTPGARRWAALDVDPQAIELQLMQAGGRLVYVYVSAKTEARHLAHHRLPRVLDAGVS